MSVRGVLISGPVDIVECACGKGDFTDSGHLCTPVKYGNESRPPDYFAVYDGHSGGPLFSKNNTGLGLLGIASRLSLDCLEADFHEGRYVDLRLPRYEKWLAQAFCAEPCKAGNDGSTSELLSVPLAFSTYESEDHHPVSVQHRVPVLLITLNHEVNGFFPEPGGDLEIRMPDTLNADCQRYYGVETCEVQNPPPGDYIIGIKAVRGNPAYQLTAVAILE